MEIIRDEEMFGLMMTPLLLQWRIERCNVSECKEKPTTVILGLVERKFGLYENHYQQVKKEGKVKFTLDFN